VDKKNQLDVTFCILYFSYNSLECTHCGIPCLQNTVLVHSESAHTVGSLTVHSAHSPGTFKECTHCGIHIVYSSHSSGTYRECTHCGIPCCLQNIVLVHTESAHTVGSHVVYKTQSCYIQRVHTLWDPMLFTKHSPGTFKECTHCGIPCCLQNTVLLHSESAHTVGSHVVYKTQSWYIQRVHTLWDPILFTKHSPSTFRECSTVESILFTVHTVLVHSESAHTVGSHVVYSAHSPGTFRECTHCGIPCCLQNTVLVHTESAHTVGSHTVHKTQYWYIQRVHTVCALSECTSTVFSYLA